MQQISCKVCPIGIGAEPTRVDVESAESQGAYGIPEKGGGIEAEPAMHQLSRPE